MVRTISVKNKDYIVVITTLEIPNIESPVQVHLDVTHLNKDDRWIVQKHAMRLFDHRLKINPTPKPQVKKPWYKFAKQGSVWSRIGPDAEAQFDELLKQATKKNESSGKLYIDQVQLEVWTSLLEEVN